MIAACVLISLCTVQVHGQQLVIRLTVKLDVREIQQHAWWQWVPKAALKGRLQLFGASFKSPKMPETKLAASGTPASVQWQGQTTPQESDGREEQAGHTDEVERGAVKQLLPCLPYMPSAKVVSVLSHQLACWLS